jgi:hypothetical protein
MCLFPWSASIDPDGGRPKLDSEGSLKLPCGKCAECLSLRASEWAIRAKHETSLHMNNCFLTLSYDDDHKESNFVLKRPFQLFMKKLRKSIEPKKIGYMVSHEYGSKTARPHHHVIIFGWAPKNQKLISYSKGGNPLFTSDEVSKLWTNGYHSIGEANEKTAYYIAAYALKGKENEIWDEQDGEIHKVSDSFDCSKNPGIGLEYLRKNYKQIVDSGDFVPRYYAKKLEEIDPEYFEKYENQKLENLKTRTPQEIHAKLEIMTSKKNLSNGEFRKSAPSDEKDLFLKRQLRLQAKEQDHAEILLTSRFKSRDLQSSYGT